MSKLVIVRGIPGSGKSTFAKKLAKETDSAHFEADMFFIKDGEYHFDASKIKEAHEWCRDQVHKSIEADQSVVVSNTFVKMWEIKPYLSMSSDIEVVEMTTRYQNVHGVPEEVVTRMEENWEEMDYSLLP